MVHLYALRLYAEEYAYTQIRGKLNWPNHVSPAIDLAGLRAVPDPKQPLFLYPLSISTSSSTIIFFNHQTEILRASVDTKLAHDADAYKGTD